MTQQMLSNEALQSLQEKFPEGLQIVGEGAQQAIVVEDKYLLDIMSVLKNDATYQFDMLSNLTAVDYLDYFEIIYHLYSLPLLSTVTIKTRCLANQLIVPSVTAIWPSADFQEREVYDLFGISFTGHQDLRRILLPDEFKGHPLRKDYKMPIQGERGA